MLKIKDRILITGINGFTGSYLKDLAAEKYDVYGLDYKGKFNKKIKKINLLDKNKLSKFINEIKPAYIIHLGAISSILNSDINKLYSINILGTKNLLDSLLPIQKNIKKIIFSSTANIYNSKEKISEETICSIKNDYAFTKYCCERLITDLFSDLPIIIARPFNYTGVGQPQSYIIPKIINSFKKKKKVIELGNIDICRDYSDVRDVVQMYMNLLHKGKINNIYNLSSGISYSINEVISKLQKITGHKLIVKCNKKLIRKNDIKIMKTNPTKINSISKLKRIKFDETLTWMLKN